MTDDLASDRLLLGRTSTAERVADILRSRIAAGYFQPGVRLAEDEISRALGVSRNTLRETFRLLSQERLVTHQLNRGVFVRVLEVDDVIDIYRVRKVVEVAAAAGIQAPTPDLEGLVDAVRGGERALSAHDWLALGTANITFHRALVALARSRRLDELMSGLLAELRLAFHVMADPRTFHEPYLARNKEVLERLTSGNGAEAAKLLEVYLDDAERQLVDAYRRDPERHGYEMPNAEVGVHKSADDRTS